jgi:hypothetical protein
MVPVGAPALTPQFVGEPTVPVPVPDPVDVKKATATPAAPRISPVARPTATIFLDMKRLITLL